MVKSVPPRVINGSARCTIRMKDQQDTSIVARKPSLLTSTTRPWSASFGENAIECTRKSSLPPPFAIRSNAASIWPGVRTSRGIKIGASSSRASGSTYFFALSLRYVTASSAPSPRNALAQPQAIDWSLAMPTMRPFLPSSSFALKPGIMTVTSPFGLRRCVPSASVFASDRISAHPKFSLRHFRNIFRNDELSLRGRDHLADGNSRTGLEQGRLTVCERDHCQLRDDQVDGTRRCYPQGAFFHDFCRTLGGVLHGDDN